MLVAKLNPQQFAKAIVHQRREPLELVKLPLAKLGILHARSTLHRGGFVIVGSVRD